MVSGLLVLSGCGAKRGVYHVVRPGETLSEIGRSYGVPYRQIAAKNRLRDPDRIFPGQKLLIPGATRKRREEREEVDIPRPGRGSLAWPVTRGVLTSAFGPRGRSFHDGIDIAAPAGTPVRAVADGRVLYSERLRGYGRLVVLRHGGGFVTLYAHNRENHVRKGEFVRKGDVIATVGDSGRTTGPNLHFEIRYRNVPRDPLEFLAPLPREIALRDAGS